MKKNFFYLCLAAFAAVGFIACSSDDDDSSNNNTPATVNLPAPTTAANAVQYTLPTLLTPISSTEEEESPQLSSIEITESSQILIELHNPVSAENTYIAENVTVNGNVYTINGTRAGGTVKVLSAATRASESTTLEIDITVTMENDVVVTYKTDENGIIVEKETAPITSEDAMTRLSRTWSILGATLDLTDLSKNETYYMEFSSRNGLFSLKDVLDEAKKRDVSFSVDEEEELSRQISCITITRSGKLILVYNTGNYDVASWTWANSEKTAFTIKLKEGSTGNKFINDDTRMETAFSDNRCNLMMNINFDDDSNTKWNASLMLKLQSR